MSASTIKLTADVYSCQEAAKILGLEPGTVRAYCACDPPRIFGRKIGRDWFITREEIERFLRNRVSRGRPAQ